MDEEQNKGVETAGKQAEEKKQNYFSDSFSDSGSGDSRRQSSV